MNGLSRKSGSASRCWHRSAVAWACLLIVAGLLPRMLFILHPLGPFPDSVEYSAIAEHLVRSGDFARTDSSLTVYRPPGYPFFMAGIYLLAGESQEAVLIAQAILGTGAGLLLYVLLRRQVADVTARITSFMAAVSPELASAAGTVLYETLLAAILVLLVYCVHRANDAGAPHSTAVRFSLWTGLAAAMAVLVTPRFMAAPAIGAIALLVGGPKSRRWRHAGLCALVSVLALMPWTIRNYRVFGILNPSAMQNPARMLWLAAKQAPPNDWRWDTLFQADPLVQRYNDLLSAWSNEQARFQDRVSSEQQLSREALRIIAADFPSYLRDRVSGYPHLWLDRQAHTVLFRGPLSFAHHHMSIVELIKSRRYLAGVLRALAMVLFFLIPTVLVPLGMVIALPRWKALVAPYLLIAWVALIHAPLFVSHRYTVPLHPVMAVFAAVALQWLINVRNDPGRRYGRGF